MHHDVTTELLRPIQNNSLAFTGNFFETQ